MAKKNDSKLDDLNLDDFDLDFNFADEPQPSPKDRNPIINTSVNAVKGFKGTVANKSFIMGVLRKALPKGFVDAYDQAERVVTKGRELYNGASSDIRPAYNDLERAAREITPIVRKKGNKGLADTIEKLFGTEQAKTAGGKFDPDEATISQSMAELFKVQAEDNEKKEQKDRAIDQLKDRTQGRRHTDLMGQQTIIADGINTLVGYQKQVTSRYQQKMLELSFRQYYAQRDMLGTLQAYARDSHTQMETIIHNTALPDILKMQASEQFVNQARARMFGKVQERVGDHFRNYTNKIFDNIEKEVKGFTRQISDGLSMGAQLVDAQRMGMEYDDGSNGEGVGGVIGMGLGHAAGAWASKQGRRLLGRNQKVQNAAARAGYLANNIPETLNDLRNNNRYYGDWRDKGMDVARRILPGPFQRNINLEQNDELFGGQPTTFDNQTHKTINEILPGYLSRILQSLESARQGKPVGRLVYNRERNAFTEQKQRTSDVAASILDNNKIAGIRTSADSMVSRIDPENKLSPEARKALADSLINQADKGESFSPTRLATGGVDFSQDPKLHREITNHFRTRYNVDAMGKIGNDAENYNRAALDSSSFKMLRETMPDVYATVNRMVNTGNAEDLRALGILVTDPNNPRKEIIDYSFIQSRVEGNDWNINDTTALAGGGGRKGGRGGGRPPRGGRGQPPVPPTPNGNRGGIDTTQLATLFDRMTTALTTAWSGFGERIDKVGERVDALGEKLDTLTTQSQTAETNLWLSRIAKMIRGIGHVPGGGGGRRRRNAAEGDVDVEDEDEDDEHGDFWDRTRGRVRRGKRKARGAFAKGKDFAGRQARKVRIGFTKGRRFAGQQLRKGWNALPGVGDILHGAGVLSNMFQDVFDVYTSPTAEAPVMTAAKMRAGLYFNLYTRDPIHKFSDIKGPVADEDGNVVLTEEDIRRGLFGKNGKPVGGSLMRGVVSAATGMIARVFGVPGQVLDMAKRTLRKSLSLTRDLIDGPEDVYVRGEESPRLLAIIMRRKGYRSKTTNEVINRPSDIDGPVVDIEGNEVLSAEDITKGLVDSKGRPVVGLGGKLLRLAKSGFGLAGKAAKLGLRAAKFAWDKTKATARAAGRGIAAAGRFGGRVLRGLTKGINFQANIGFGVGVGGASVDNVVHGLEAIYNLLDDRLGGKSSFRTGSWQEKFSQRENPKSTKEKLERAASGNPMLKYLMMFGGAVMSGFAWIKSKFGKFFDGLKGLLSVKRGAGVAGDIADAAGDVAGNGRRRPGRMGRLARGAGGLLKKGGKFLMGAGGLALRALPFAGTALASAATAVASVITAPVAIAVGVAAAGYFAYKYFKGRPDAFQRLRLAEYGFDPSDKDALKKIIEMEGFLLPNVSTINGRATLNNVNSEELLTRVGIGAIDQQPARAFTDWYARRFAPVFLRNVSALKAVAPGVSIMEVNDKLDKSLKADYATATKDSTRDAPYNVGGQPFAELDPLTTGTTAIDAEIASIRKDFADYRKAPADTATPAQSASAAVPGVVPVPPSRPNGAGGYQPANTEYITPSEKTGGYEPGITVKNWSPGSNRLIDDLTAVRMRLYGLTALDISHVNALTTLESNLGEVITISNDGKVKMSKSPEAIYKENAGLFGRNPTDLKSQSEWVSWFNYRFLPVYTQFLSALWGINRNIKPGLAWKYLRPADMLSIADLLKGVRAQSPDGAVSVWAVKASAFPGMAANSDISSIDTNITSLQQQVKNNNLQERTPNANAQSQKQGSGTAGANANAASTGAAADAGKPGFFQRVKNWFTGNGDAPSAALGGAGLGTGYKGGMALGGAGSGGPAAAAMGTPIAQPGNGTGGDINQIPQPEGDGSWDALKKTIVAAANMAGVDPGLMASMAFVESNFRAAVKPGTSAAQGLYQFIPSTWRSMMQKYASKYGIDPNTPPSDPRANALMGAEYLKENQKILEQKLGRPVTGTDLYLSHFLGSAGGPRLLKAPSGDLAQNHADASAVNANRTIFFAGGRPKTVAEVIAWANKRIEGDGGKFMSEANALAGNPQSLKAANQPVGDAANEDSAGAATSPTGAVSPVGKSGGSDDGQVAYAETQRQAMATNASTGLPASRPAPMGGSGGTAMPSGGGGASGEAASAADYTADVQAQARSSKQAAQSANTDAMLDVQNQQLEVQKTMSDRLARLVELFEAGGAPSSGPAADSSSPGDNTPQSKPSSPQRQGTNNAGAKRVTAPISMKRTG